MSKGTDIAIANTLGKPTTRLMTVAKNSPTLKNLLKTFRYDTFKFTDEVNIEDVIKGEDVGIRSYNEVLSDYAGKYMVQYEDAIRPLLKGFKNKKLEDVDQDILISLMRSKKAEELYKKNPLTSDKLIRELVPNATLDHVKAYKTIKRLSQQVLSDGRKIGVYRRELKRGPNAWMARRWKWSVVKEDRAELAQIMVDSNATVIDDNVILNNLPTQYKEEFLKIKNKFNATEELLDEFNKKALVEIQREVGEVGSVITKDKETTNLIQALDDLNNQKRKFLQYLPDNADIRNAKLRKANEVIDDMLSKRDFVEGVDGETLGTMMPSSFSPRNLFMLDDNDIYKFLDNDFDTLMRDYFNTSSRLFARKSLFGASKVDFVNEFIPKIREELEAAGSSFKKSDANALIDIFEYATGLNEQGFKSRGLNTLSDSVKLSQQLAHLPLATVSSLTEILIPLSRVSSDVYVKGIKDGFKNASTSFYDNTTSLLQSENKLTREEAHREMHRVMMGLEQAVAQRIDSLHGEGIQSPLVRKIQEKFFYGTLLSQWTRTVQLASFTMGKDMITRNLRTVAELTENGIPKGNRKLNQAVQELHDLGVNVHEGVNWIKRGGNKYALGENRNTGIKNWDYFYENNVIQGASRFANEVILNPSKAAVTRPHVQQSTYGTILFQFLGYPTAFNNTVLKNFILQAKRNPVTGTAKVASSAMLMTGVATAMNAVRSNGKSLEKEPDEILKESIARWGGLGFVDYLDRIDKNYEIGGGAFGSVVKGLTGPVVGDVFDALAYRKGPGEVIATNVPFYSALDAASNVGEKITGEDLDLKKAVKSAGREIDYNTSVNLGLREPRKELSLEGQLMKPYRDLMKPFRDMNFKGGELDQEVDRASNDPSTNKDRMTGNTYASQTQGFIPERKKVWIGGVVKKGLQAFGEKYGLNYDNLVKDPLVKNLKGLFDKSETTPNYKTDENINSGLALQTTPEENEFYKNNFIEFSEEKADQFYVQPDEGDAPLMGFRTSSLSEANDTVSRKTSEDRPVVMGKGSIRVNNAFEFKGDVPDAPFFLIFDNNFLKSVKKDEKRFIELGKDYQKVVEHLDTLDYKGSSITKNQLLSEITISYNKKFYEIMKDIGYDSIKYEGEVLPVEKSVISSGPSQLELVQPFTTERKLSADYKIKKYNEPATLFNEENIKKDTIKSAWTYRENLKAKERQAEILEEFKGISKRPQFIDPGKDQPEEIRRAAWNSYQEQKAEWESKYGLESRTKPYDEKEYPVIEDDLVDKTESEILRSETEDLIEMQSRPVFNIELSIKDKIARSNFNVEGKRKPSYILFDMDSQFLPWGRTSPATNREIDFVNSKSVSENTNLVNEENVTNTPSSVISNILRDGRPFHMVSTASDNIPMGHIISYMPINKEKLQNIKQNLDLEDSQQAEIFKALENKVDKHINLTQSLLNKEVGKSKMTDYSAIRDNLYRYVMVETVPGYKNQILRNRFLTETEAINSIKFKTSEDPNRFWYHPPNNNILHEKARYWRLINSNKLNVDQSEMQKQAGNIASVLNKIVNFQKSQKRYSTWGDYTKSQLGKAYKRLQRKYPEYSSQAKRDIAYTGLLNKISNEDSGNLILPKEERIKAIKELNIIKQINSLSHKSSVGSGYTKVGGDDGVMVGLRDKGKKIGIKEAVEDLQFQEETGFYSDVGGTPDQYEFEVRSPKRGKDAWRDEVEVLVPTNKIKYYPDTAIRVDKDTKETWTTIDNREQYDPEARGEDISVKPYFPDDPPAKDPSIKTGTDWSETPEGIKGLERLKTQARKVVKEETKGLPPSVENYLMEAWIYDVTGGAAGNYKPLINYFSRRSNRNKYSNQALVRDLLEEFSKDPDNFADLDTFLDTFRIVKSPYISSSIEQEKNKKLIKAISEEPDIEGKLPKALNPSMPKIKTSRSILNRRLNKELYNKSELQSALGTRIPSSYYTKGDRGVRDISDLAEYFAEEGIPHPEGLDPYDSTNWDLNSILKSIENNEPVFNDQGKLELWEQATLEAEEKIRLLEDNGFDPLKMKNIDVAKTLANFLFKDTRTNYLKGSLVQALRVKKITGGVLDRLKEEPSMKIEKFINGEPENIYLEYGETNIPATRPYPIRSKTKYPRRKNPYKYTQKKLLRNLKRKIQ